MPLTKTLQAIDREDMNTFRGEPQIDRCEYQFGVGFGDNMLGVNPS